MILTAHMLAYADGRIREIDIPDSEIGAHWETEQEARMGLLELAFYYGQNDFQPRPIPSLSVGDVVALPDGSLHRVRGVGWEHLPEGTSIETLERGRDACFLF